MLLAVAFLLTSCESVESSRGPSKEQAVSQLKTATTRLQGAIEKEVKARKAYVASVPAGQKVETAMLRLLRRIVVLGQTPQKDRLQEWRAAKKNIETQRGEVTAAIATLCNAGGRKGS